MRLIIYLLCFLYVVPACSILKRHGAHDYEVCIVTDSATGKVTAIKSKGTKFIAEVKDGAIVKVDTIADTSKNWSVWKAFGQVLGIVWATAVKTIKWDIDGENDNTDINVLSGSQNKEINQN